MDFVHIGGGGGQGNFVSIFTSLGVFRAKNGGIFIEMKRRISHCFDHTKYFKTLAPMSSYHSSDLSEAMYKEYVKYYAIFHYSETH